MLYYLYKGKPEKRPTLNSTTFYPLWAAVTIAVVAAIFCPWRPCNTGPQERR